MMPLRLVPEARVRQRFREQERIAELVADAFFERIHVVIKLFRRGCFSRKLIPSRSYSYS